MGLLLVEVDVPSSNGYGTETAFINPEYIVAITPHYSSNGVRSRIALIGEDSVGSVSVGRNVIAAESVDALAKKLRAAYRVDEGDDGPGRD